MESNVSAVHREPWNKGKIVGLKVNPPVPGVAITHCARKQELVPTTLVG